MVSEWESPRRTGVVHDMYERTMNEAIRDQWCAALLSGKYKEGRYYLRTVDDEFDALGVLCDIAVKAGVCNWDKLTHSQYYMIYGLSNSLPNPVREWAGIRGNHPAQDVALDWEGAMHPVWRLTDHYKMEFSTISQLIASQY